MVVQRALQWLKRNNKYYRNIDIDVSVLSQLPDDGDLTDKYGVGIEDTAEKQEEEELPSEDTDPADVATSVADLGFEKGGFRILEWHDYTHFDCFLP